MTIKADKTLTPAYQKSAGAPDENQLARINGFALTPQTAEQVYVRTAYLAHNAIDRDGEVFDDAVLDDFARTLPGKGMFVKHPRGWDGESGPGTGRWFEAITETMSFEDARAKLREPNLKWPPGVSMAKLLKASYYLPRTEKNTNLIADTDAGVAGDVSIGFRAADRSAIADGDGNRIGLRILGPAEALEGSMVWLGAQPGARVVKAARRSTDNPEDNDMDLKQENEKLNKELGDLRPKATAYDAIEKALGKELLADPAALVVLINDGKALREELIYDVVKAERVAGLITGDDDKTVNDAKAGHRDTPVSKLKAWLTKLTTANGKGGQLGGGDPNHPKTEGDKPKADEHGIPNALSNPAITGKAA